MTADSTPGDTKIVITCAAAIVQNQVLAVDFYSHKYLIWVSLNDSYATGWVPLSLQLRIHYLYITKCHAMCINDYLQTSQNAYCA
jgi:hypothetical protein